MGKGGESSAKEGNKTETVELLIDGTVYDVTNMKHPGGSVINFYAGKGFDATQAFNQFHIRSPKVLKYLASLPQRKAADKDLQVAHPLKDQEKLLTDFEKFSQQLRDEGFFDCSPLHTIYRVLEIAILYAAGIWMVRTGGFWIIPGVISMAIAQGRCGWEMHEGGHYSMLGNVAFDKTCQILLFGIGCGMSASWWRSQHNRHHTMPQKVGYDVDLNTLPLVAFTEKMVKKVGSLHKVWLKAQAYLFPLITTSLVAAGWQFFLHPRHMLRKSEGLEMACLVFRYAVWTALFTIPYGLKFSALLYLAYNWIGANYIFINFALSHTHLGVVPKDDKEMDWIRYASIYTMNIYPGPLSFINWWMGYLNFQIEHHLFPCMPQFRHSQISPRVKKFFEEHGLVYRQEHYFKAMDITFKNLHKVGMEIFYG